MIRLLSYLTNSKYWLYLRGVIRNWRECCLGAIHYLFLNIHKISSKSVLIIEFNQFHGETLPGYVHYFQELNYDVTVLTRYRTWKESPFIRMKFKPIHYCLTIWAMRNFLQSRKSNLFSVVFFNSFQLSLEEYRYYGNIRNFLSDKCWKDKKKWLCIEHHLSNQYQQTIIKFGNNSKEYNDLLNHTFMLTPIIFDGHIVPMLNPCYFGEFKRIHRTFFRRKRIFIAIGGISFKNRNFSQLINSINDIDRKDDYEIRIIGKIKDQSVVSSLPSNISILGRLIFDEMYHQLMEADFFLPLLSPEIQSYYLDGCTSGSKQLIIGFCIPSIMHSAFASAYGFNKNDYIEHETDNKFNEAFLQALTMSDDEYISICNNLNNLKTKIEDISIRNLLDYLNKTRL